MKILTYLTTGMCALIISISSPASALAPNVDWSAFAGSGGPAVAYSETKFAPLAGVVTVTSSALFGSPITTTPMAVNTVLGGPPWTPVPGPTTSMMTVEITGSPTVYSIELLGSSIFLPGQFIGIGGLSPISTSNGIFFDGGTAGVTVVGNFDVIGGFHPGIEDLAWSSVTGALTFVSGAPAGDSGILVFQNTSGAPINSVEFLHTDFVGPSTAAYLVATAPEPSTYLVMAGGLGALCILAMRRKAKAKI